MSEVLWGLFLAGYALFIAAMAYAHKGRDRSVFLSGMGAGVALVALANKVIEAVLG